MEQEVRDLARVHIRQLYSRILDASNGDEQTFKRLAAIAAKQMASETFQLLGPELSDKALNNYI